MPVKPTTARVVNTDPRPVTSQVPASPPVHRGELLVGLGDVRPTVGVDGVALPEPRQQLRLVRVDEQVTQHGRP
jgi:hypothetical protein